jgi:hypothetical protein
MERGKMANLLPHLKKFCAVTLDSEKIDPPVTVQLLDSRSSVIFEMEATGKGEGGVWRFSVGGLLSLPVGDFTVQFTAAGKRPFTREWRFAAAGSQRADSDENNR